MSPQVSAVLEPLERAIDDLGLPVDGIVLAEAFGLYDRLSAKLTEAVGEIDAAGLWEPDGATSMTAWLRHHARRTHRDAAVYTKTAKRLRHLPVTATAHADGTLSGGQVQAIVANLNDRTAPLFAEHETDVIPTLGDLSVHDTASAMQLWARRAQALLDDDEPPTPPERSLHLSRTLEGRRELSGSLDAEAGGLAETALRLAETADTDGEPDRTSARRRADALVDILRFFLDHQTNHPGGRHRPHLNVLIDLDDLDHGQARLFDGTILDPATIQRLLCDAGVHRVVTAGRSSILDYGTTTRTIPANLWAALVARDKHCRFPGCDRPPEWCEAHHVIWVSNGGPTALGNLMLGCARHHHLLHLPGWHVKMLPDGTIDITTPDGRTLHSRPPP